LPQPSKRAPSAYSAGARRNRNDAQKDWLYLSITRWRRSLETPDISELMTEDVWLPLAMPSRKLQPPMQVRNHKASDVLSEFIADPAATIFIAAVWRDPGHTTPRPPVDSDHKRDRGHREQRRTSNCWALRWPHAERTRANTGRNSANSAHGGRGYLRQRSYLDDLCSHRGLCISLSQLSTIKHEDTMTKSHASCGSHCPTIAGRPLARLVIASSSLSNGPTIYPYADGSRASVF